MIREKDTIYIEGEKFIRPKKKKELLKQAEGRIRRLTMLLNSHGKDSDSTKERLEKQLNKAKRELERLKGLGEMQHKHLKHSTKNYKKDVLKKLIIESINNETDEYVSVENYAFKFKAKQGLVNAIFFELIREGVLSQKIRNYAHDTSRNPIFPMDISGWASNLYLIKKKG